MPKLRKFREFEVTVSGMAVLPFTFVKNQVAGNLEQAVRIVKKTLRGSELDPLSPRVTTGKPKVKTVETKQVTPPKTGL